MKTETLGGRIRMARGSTSMAEASSRLAVHEQTLGKYERGVRVPDADFLVRLHAEFGVSVDWLLTGAGTMLTADERAALAAPAEAAVPLDEDLLAAIADGIARVYKEENARLSEGDKGRLIARTYNDLVAAYDDPDGRKAGLPMALLQLRRDLRAAPVDDSSKRLA